MTPIFALLLVQTSPKISVSFPPTPIRKALKILSDASGRRLEVGGAFADEVVLARVKDAPVDATLDHLAQSLYARWQREPNGVFMLVKDQEALRRRERQDATDNRKTLLNSLSYLRGRLAEQPAELDRKSIQRYVDRLASEDRRRKAAEAAKDYEHMFVASTAAEESPAWRALASLIPLLDQSYLLGMPNDAREVWAERPTPMQHPLPVDAVSVLNRYRRELALLDPTKQVARVRLIAKKWEHGAAFNMSLEAVDVDGKTIDKGFARMNDDSKALKIPFTERNRFDPKPGEVPFEVSKDAKEARIVMANEGEEQARRELLLKWRPRIMDPVQFEPTQWHFGADLVAAAQAADRNLIGATHDIVGARYWKERKSTPSQLFARSQGSLVVGDDGWLVVRMQERFSRASRSRAATLLRNSRLAGGITVDAAADWAGACEDRWPFVNWLGDYLSILFPGSGPYSALATVSDDLGLRLWDSLGAGVRSQLRAGGSVRLSDLPSKAKERIFDDVYWFEGLDEPGIEPTERLPNGIADGSLTMTTSEMPVFVGWSSKAGPPASQRPIDAKSFGTFLANGNSYWEVPAEIYRAYDRFLLGVHRSYELHFQIQPGAVPMTVTLTETLFNPSAKATDQLPANLLAEAESSRKAAVAAKPEKGEVIPPTS
ncbi:hypothetical protein [Fimbriimonas ginsengisoli]|uniref:Uncharacterized protein n=1 Tax=Fimbriimonas ginsengisoli Gsoil 348 TaxID=661478 RepID=A0A068NV42_FIMGI|nr:hypothetical protein [Fimbriimonas ginsengisoli]AIE87237.1 hypothetical protein OP10G_3869 [Fimbriimonas ginsengisoli Gsoil 348]